MAEIVTSPAEQAKWKQLHALALSIYQAQQRANQFQAAGDLSNAAGEVGTVQTLRGLFDRKADEIRMMTGSVLTDADDFILSVGEWVQDFVRAIPGATAAIPSAIIDGLAKIAGRAGASVGLAALPWAAIALGVVGLLLVAEKSSTVRRLVK